MMMMLLSYVALGGAWAPQDAPRFVYPLYPILGPGCCPPVGGGAPWHSTREARPSFAIVLRWLRFPVRLSLPIGLTRYRGQPVASVSVASASEVISLAPLSLPAIALT